MATTTSASSRPFIRVVVLAFDGAEMTLECVQSVLDSGWPEDRQEVVLVDNGSLDDVLELVRNRCPQVRILEPLANLGFAGGCNFGIMAETDSDGTPLKPFDHVALVNNDAIVTKSWLDALVAVLEADSNVGAAVPKMLLYHRYFEVEVSRLFPDSPDYDNEPVCISGARFDGSRNDGLLSFDEGFGGPSPYSIVSGEEFARWSMHGGRMRYVAPEKCLGEVHLSLRVGARAPGWVKLRINDTEKVIRVGPGTLVGPTGHQWVEMATLSGPVDVINNVGSELYVGGSAGDRGFLERDVGQYDQGCEIFAWCGGAVLLRKAYLDDVGLFDEAFFLYYEDTDLSWRGRLQGWRYVYTPDSVVRHRHSQSSGVGSDLFRFQVERNRLLVLVKNARLRVVTRAVAGEVKRFIGVALREVVRPIFLLRRPRLHDFRIRGRILKSFFRCLPSAMSHRWMLDTRNSRRQVMKWATTKIVPIPVFEPPITRFHSTVDESKQSGNFRDTAAVYNQYWTTYGGGEIVSGSLARALSGNFDVTLLGPEKPNFEMFRQRLGIDLSTFPWRQVNGDDEASLASRNYDVFVNTTYLSGAVNAAPVGLYYVHFPGKPVAALANGLRQVGIRLATVGTHVPLISSKFRRICAGMSSSVADNSWTDSYSEFLANSKYTQFWTEKMWGKQSEVLYPPVSPVTTPATKTSLIMTVGRFFDPSFGHSKKQLELVSAFSTMIRSDNGFAGWRLSVVGGADGKSRDFVMKVRRAAQKLPIDIHVNAPRATLEDGLSKASIYWHAGGFGEDPNRHPDRLEHFGISVVEAMAAGAVPVVFGAAGPAEIVRHGIDGFHWQTLEELVSYTHQLMGDTELRNAMSKSAMSRAAEFGFERFESEALDIVRQCQAKSHTR